MFKGNNNLAVGLFVSVALASVAAFSMWFAGSKGSVPTERYSILFERDVSGLSLGGPVYFMGVQVGSVVDMGLIPGDRIKVRVDIDVAADTPIDAGSYATLAPQGITGVNVINIASEPGDQGELQRIEGFEYPLIPVRETGLSALLAKAPDTMSKLNALLDQANAVLDETNREALARTLSHIESLTAALDERRETIAGLPGEMQSLVAASRETVQDLKASVDALQPDLAATLAQVNDMTRSLAELMQRFDTWVAQNEPEIRHFIDDGLGQTPELMFDLRSTLRDLQKLLQQLQQNPSQLIHRTPDDALEVPP